MSELFNRFNAKNAGKHIIEKDLYQFWMNFCNNNSFNEGQILKGIDPGVLNETDGPDFQGAEFELNNKIYRGDVEIHLKCGDWFKHGHHLDKRYDRVVLHLVNSNEIQSVYNSKNQEIPTLSLKTLSFLEKSFDKNKHCCNFNTFFKVPVAVLQELALKRLTGKTIEIKNGIASNGIDQTLYVHILRILGSASNIKNYQRLAQIIPWKLVYVFKQQNKNQDFWSALFLGAAGLLPQHKNPELFEIWRQILPLIEGLPLKQECWTKGGVRPKNFPQNRLLGFATFISGLDGSSIFHCISKIFYQRYSVKTLIDHLYTFFNNDIKDNKYKNHFGKNIILELTGNVFIPFFLRIAAESNSVGFDLYLKQVFLEIPFSEKYSILQFLDGKIEANKIAEKYFFYYQALLHVHNNYCSRQNCFSCPLQTIEQKN